MPVSTSSTSAATQRHHRTTNALPEHNPKHWTAAKKVAVVRGVHNRIITRDEALTFYRITEGEFRDWEETIYEAGVKALKLKAIERRRRPGK